MEPFMIRDLPFKTEINYNLIAKRLLSANASVSKFDGMLEENAISKDLFLNPITKKEAVLSSKIEGTQATLTEFLEIEAEDGKTTIKTKYDDFIEISNYNKAIDYAEKELNEKGKITLWMIRNIHRILLNGARGKDMNPGEVRKDQNWIGKPGSTIKEATFIPVSPDKLIENLENLENYISNYEEQSSLIQAAIIHVQFEKIHPFKDGNGRIGRMLIPLFLYYKKVIERPVLYISEYFEENRDEYYDRLNEIDSSDNLNPWMKWIDFFLNAVETQSSRNINKIRKLQSLHEEYKIMINEILNTKNSIYVVDALFKIPIFKSVKLHEELTKKITIDFATTKRYIKRLVDSKVLTIEQGKIRDKKYYFTKLIETIQ